MLLVYDFDFNLLLAEPDIIKSRWVIYYNDVGTFEAHLPVTSELVKIISEKQYLVVCEKGFSAIVVGYQLSNELVLYGRTCNWLLSKRITQKFDKNAVYPGDTAAGFVRDAFSDVENFVIGSIAWGEESEFEKKECKTLEAVRDCLELSNLGHRVVFNKKAKTWEFEVFSGCENDLILSEAHKNAYGTKISRDILDFASCGIYQRKTDNGYERTQIQKNGDKTGIYRWEALLYDETEGDAMISLNGLCPEEKISLNAEEVFFGKDYGLGDTVRLQIIKGEYKKTEKRRICGVEISLDKGVYKEQPVFD